MSFLIDLLPVLLFFGVFKFAGRDPDSAARWASEHLGWLVSDGRVDAVVAPTLIATLVVVAATCLQVLVMALLRKKISPVLWLTLVLVVLLGGATVWFHSETFIKWKPTVFSWILAFVLAVGQLMGRNLLRLLMGQQLHLPGPVWNRLTAMWIIYFALQGAVNLWVAYTFSLDTWVTFKAFGLLSMTFAFVLLQAVYLSRHMQDEPTGAERDATASP